MASDDEASRLRARSTRSKRSFVESTVVFDALNAVRTQYISFDVSNSNWKPHLLATRSWTLEMKSSRTLLARAQMPCRRASMSAGPTLGTWPSKILRGKPRRPSHQTDKFLTTWPRDPLAEQETSGFSALTANATRGV